MQAAVSYTIGEIASLGKDNIPAELLSGKGLVYSSPATLAFNSPGAEGFGVKRAGLAVPESVMLIVSPGCCGRNTTLVSSIPGYEDRFFYLLMDESDLVTGRHLTKIPGAIAEVLEFLKGKGKSPKVVLICITCVDALLGTDMERVARKCEEKNPQVRVLPCYMYALTREGRRPPMVHVRQSIYSLLEKGTRRKDTVNILGNFAPVNPKSDLLMYLKAAGFSKINQIATCKTYEEFEAMNEANLNIVLNREAYPAAEDMYKKLGIPFVELTPTYDIDKMLKQYTALSQTLGVKINLDKIHAQVQEYISKFVREHEGLTVNIGECLNANPFELALSLSRYGVRVAEIYATLSPEQFVYIKRLNEIAPDIKIFCNLEPTMLNYASSSSGADLSIGKDAAFYLPDVPNIPWNSDIVPFGFSAVKDLFGEIAKEAEA